MWTENLCYKLGLMNIILQRNPLQLASSPVYFVSFLTTATIFILYYPSYEVNPCWLPYLWTTWPAATRVISQGKGKNPGNEVDLIAERLYCGPPFGANSRYLNPCNRRAFKYIKNQRVKTWLLRTCRAKIWDRFLFSKIYVKKNCITLTNKISQPSFLHKY